MASFPRHVTSSHFVNLKGNSFEDILHTFQNSLPQFKVFIPYRPLKNNVYLTVRVL